jgi:hypothetical protein
MNQINVAVTISKANASASTHAYGICYKRANHRARGIGEDPQ